MERVHEIGCELEDARAAVKQIMVTAKAEARDISSTERTSLAALTSHIDSLEREQRLEQAQIEHDRSGALAVDAPAGEGPLHRSIADVDDGPALALPKLPERTRRKLAAMAGSGAALTPAAKSEHFAAVVAAALGGNPLHPALLPMAATGNESVGSEGGFGVVPEVAAGIFVRAAEESVFARVGARVEPMASDEKTIVALDDDDESGDAEAGMTASWTAETADATAQLMRIRAVVIHAVKLMVLAAVSNELADDAQGLMAEYEAAIARAIGKRLDRAIVSGSGAGQPLGLLASGATIEVAKTVGGDPGLLNTFTWLHAVGMWSRLSPGSHERAYWLMHPTVLPQALSMSVAVKNMAGVENVGGFQPGGAFTAGGPTGYMLLGRPVAITGRVKPLSTKGDVILCDPSQIAIGIRRQITIDRSPHVYFSSDRLAIRGKFRGNALPIWETPRTLQEGSVTVSPYVVLATRT